MKIIKLMCWICVPFQICNLCSAVPACQYTCSAVTQDGVWTVQESKEQGKKRVNVLGI